eukprot:742125_1
MKILSNNDYQIPEKILCGETKTGSGKDVKYVFQVDKNSADYEIVSITNLCEAAFSGGFEKIDIFNIDGEDMSDEFEQATEQQGFDCDSVTEIAIPNSENIIASGTGYKFSISGDAYSFGISCQSKCHERGVCPYGYMDKTDGDNHYWYCGQHCPGGKYTDTHCNCACVAATDCPAASAIYWTDYITYVVGVSVVVNMIFLITYWMKKRKANKYEKVLVMDDDDVVV